MKYFVVAFLLFSDVAYGQNLKIAFPPCFTATDTLKYRDSIAFFTEQIKYYPKSAALYSRRAYYKTGVNDLPGSVQDYCYAVELDSTYHPAVYSLGLNSVFLKDYTTAEYYLKKAIQLNPNDADAKYTLGLVMYTQQRYNDALIYFTTCNHTGIYAANAAGLTGYCYMELEKYDKALSTFDTLLQQAPKSADYLCQKARAQAGLSKYGQALHTFEQCLKLRPAYADAFYYRAGVYETMGNKRAAAKDYYQCALLGDEDAMKILAADYKPWYKKLRQEIG